MQLSFTKMHGLGNDFIVFEADGSRPLPDAAILRRLADRRTGIGFDQALVLEPARRADTDVFYRIFNADGSEVEQCGNGARCIARFISLKARGARERQAAGHASTAGPQQGNRATTVQRAPAELARANAAPVASSRTDAASAKELPVESSQLELKMDSTGGLIHARLRADGLVSVNMGVPDFAPRALPFDAAAESDRYKLALRDGELEIGAVSMGNPHAVLLVPDVDTAPVDRVGPEVENHRRFPNRTNVGFMQVLDRTSIRLRVFERGVGETLACGTGACAAVAVGRKWGLLDERVGVRVLGGELTLEWPGAGQPIWMTGPAEVVYVGTVDL